MFEHNGKTHNVASCTNQINCSLALVTAETKGSVSHIAAATSGWLPSNFSPYLRPPCVQIAGERTLFHISQVAPKWAKVWSRVWEGNGSKFWHGSAKVGIEFACIMGRFAVRIIDLMGLWVADQRIILQLAWFPFLPQRYFIEWSQYFIKQRASISKQIAT